MDAALRKRAEHRMLDGRPRQTAIKSLVVRRARPKADRGPPRQGVRPQVKENKVLGDEVATEDEESSTEGGSSGQRTTSEVVNDLSVNLLVAAEDRETWTLGGSVNTTANAGLDARTRFGFLFRIHCFRLFRCRFASLATDLLAQEANTFSFVRLDFAQRADFGGHHAKQLLVM